MRCDDDFEQWDGDDEFFGQPRTIPTQFLPDDSKSIITENSSPDIPFRVSINPYRGCEHGCAYCYARPGHEFLGMNAGLDFEGEGKGTGDGAFGGDPIAEWNKRLAAKVDAGMPRMQAASRLNREVPGLREAYVEASNLQPAN